jgi:hypothetical protein
MRVVAFLFGLILLLPGACALGFLVMGVSALPSLGSSEWRDSAVWGMIGIATVGWGLCFLISFGGVMIIRGALRLTADSPRDAGTDDSPSGD